MQKFGMEDMYYLWYIFWPQVYNEIVLNQVFFLLVEHEKCTPNKTPQTNGTRSPLISKKLGTHKNTPWHFEQKNPKNYIHFKPENVCFFHCYPFWCVKIVFPEFFLVRHEEFLLCTFFLKTLMERIFSAGIFSKKAKKHNPPLRQSARGYAATYRLSISSNWAPFQQLI